jgi:hypothetical protein
MSGLWLPYPNTQLTTIKFALILQNHQGQTKREPLKTTSATIWQRN